MSEYQNHKGWRLLLDRSAMVAYSLGTAPRALGRLTPDPDVRFGKPCVRGHRITVQEILEWLSSGASQEKILADYPQLQPDDFLAVYAYAAELAAGTKVSGG